MTMQEPLPATPAATVIVFRNGSIAGQPELLMVTRSKVLNFAGGMAVFPGGRVDDADRDLARQLGLATDVDDAAARIAAIRETLEETGLALGLTRPVEAQEAAAARALLHEGQELAAILGRFGWELNAEALVPFARWLPNHAHARIFDTRFYLADLGTGSVDIAVDQTENTRLFWTSANAALERADKGEISIIFPTRRNLERLAQFGSFADARQHAQDVPVRIVTPWVEERNNQPTLCIPDDAGYPITAESLASAETVGKPKWNRQPSA
ncbi:MAG: NUDIX domain-containing protein [Novosphingobium sp.]|jgi:8-oxo-dGTP pyrophosphatase MutT (NUDIX family)